MKTSTTICMLLLTVFFGINSTAQQRPASENKAICVFSETAEINAEFPDGYYNFHSSETKACGFKSENGSYLIDPVFERIDFSGHYFRLYIDPKKTFDSRIFRQILSRLPKERSETQLLIADRKGMIVFGLDEEVIQFYNGFSGIVPVKKNSDSELRNIYSDKVISHNYDLVSFADTNLIWVSKNEKCGLIDTLGNVIVPLTYDMIDFPRTLKNGVYGIMNHSGKQLINGYEDAYSFLDVATKKNYSTGFTETGSDLFDANGNKLTSFPDRKISGVDDAIVSLNRYDPMTEKSYSSYYNLQTEKYITEEIENTTSSFTNFRFGNAIVSKNGLEGIINSKGEFVLPCEYRYVDRGKKHIVACKEGKSFLFDHNGKLVREFPFYKIEFRQRITQENELFFYSGGMMGLTDLDGNILLEAKYNSSFIGSDNYLWLLDQTTGQKVIYNTRTHKIVDSTENY